MSFRYNGRFVALDNYKQIFGGSCIPDVLDEIRSAVLDHTPIADYIEDCGDDAYLLGQIRMALREDINPEYLDTRFTGKTIFNIRQAARTGADMSAILWYATPQKLKIERDSIEVLSEFCLVGADIRRVDFTLVPKSLVSSFCRGLYKGYPMWLLTDDSANISEQYLRVLMRGMELGVDVHPFVSGNWDVNVLLLLFSYAKAVNLNEVLSYVNNKFDMNQVKVILDLMSSGIPVSRLCIRDHSGAPVYNQYQMYELGESLKAGIDVKQMYNPKLSDYDMARMREQVLASRVGT